METYVPINEKCMIFLGNVDVFEKSFGDCVYSIVKRMIFVVWFVK